VAANSFLRLRPSPNRNREVPWVMDRSSSTSCRTAPAGSIGSEELRLCRRSSKSLHRKVSIKNPILWSRRYVQKEPIKILWRNRQKRSESGAADKARLLAPAGFGAAQRVSVRGRHVGPPEQVPRRFSHQYIEAAPARPISESSRPAALANARFDRVSQPRRPRRSAAARWIAPNSV